jgi:hypothetical protein
MRYFPGYKLGGSSAHVQVNCIFLYLLYQTNFYQCARTDANCAKPCSTRATSRGTVLNLNHNREKFPILTDPNKRYCSRWST